MPGPLPNPNAIRRNKPTVPTVALPLSGRQGDPPDVPSWTTLSTAGAAWWAWAWATPQAVAWGTSVGMESVVAQRASLEDDLATLDSVDGLDWDDLFGVENNREFKAVISRVAALVTGRLAILKHMNALDDQLGLTPKGMAHLRWKIIDDTPVVTSAAKKSRKVSSIADRRARLTADAS